MTQTLPIIEPPSQTSKGRYAFISLGCPKNLVDSEKMLGRLTIDGYQPVSEPDGSDFVVVNTCGFIESSRLESKSVIHEMIDLKRAGRTGGVIVAGCLAERAGSDLLDEIPEIDHIVGVFGREEISEVADRLRANRLTAPAREQRELFRPAPIRAEGSAFLDDTARIRLTPDHYAYLKISEGCDRTCTFCAIPKMRGKHVTKPVEQVVAEANELAQDGVRELVLVAQDTTYYGMDLYGEVRLSPLLKELEKVDGIDWIRLMYLYPVNFTDELIDTIAGSEKIIPYLDMPLQHINSRVLKRMQRRVNRDKTVALIEKLNERVANLTLRTTFVVGFPGETEEQFEELRDFVDEGHFSRLGVFPFSPEPGTPAMRLDGHLPPEVAQQRADAIMEVQQPHAFAFAESLVGYELDCLIDEVDEEGMGIGRTYADAPEIDAVVKVAVADGAPALEVGQLVPVELVESEGYDWIAEYHGSTGADADLGSDEGGNTPPVEVENA